MNKRYTPKTYDQGISFLDPSSCGSTIAWRVVDSGWEGKSFECSVQLTDCTKMIIWNVECDDNGIKKIENAITVLQEALDAIKIGKEKQDAKIAKEEKEKKRKKKKKQS